MSKKIKWSDLKQLSGHDKSMHDGHWHKYLGPHRVSIIKWSKDWYNGYYEIWSYGTLFWDVERYKTKSQVLSRLNELAKEHE